MHLLNIIGLAIIASVVLFGTKLYKAAAALENEIEAEKNDLAANVDQEQEDMAEDSLAEAEGES